VPNGNYAAMTGTSMATPIVTGSAALLLQKDPNYSLDAPRLVADLLRLVQPPSTPGMGRGRLHLQAI
jgi:subtilisin family serine protease